MLSFLLYLTLFILSFVTILIFEILRNPLKQKPLLGYKPLHFHRNVKRSSIASDDSNDCSYRVSRALDQRFSEMIDLLLRDFFLSWYSQFSCDEGQSSARVIKEELMGIYENLYNLFGTIDATPFMCEKIIPLLTTHFQELKITQFDSSTTSELTVMPFCLHPCMETPEKEMEYLRKLSESLLSVTISSYALEVTQTRLLAREMFVVFCFKMTLDMMSDPAWFNGMLLSQLNSMQKARKRIDKSVNYEDFESFFNAVKTTSSLEKLYHLREKIIKELNQATMMNIVKEQNLRKGIRFIADKNKIQTKADQLMARDLSRYITQLSFAKSRVDNKIREMGGKEWEGSSKPLPDVEIRDSASSVMSEPITSSSPTNTRITSFFPLLHSPEARKYFEKYLKRHGNQKILLFWVAIQEIRTMTEASDVYKRVSEIYDEYVKYNTDGAFSLPRNKSAKMWDYIIGNANIEEIYIVQMHAYQVMEKDFFPSFLMSKEYMLMSHKKINQTEAEYDEVEAENESIQCSIETNEDTLELRIIQDKRKRKEQVVMEMRKSRKPDYKLLVSLETEINELQEKELELDSHIMDFTDWINVHHWVDVFDAFSPADRSLLHLRLKEIPVFEIMVYEHGPDFEDMSSEINRRRGGARGKVVFRNLVELRQLHSNIKFMLPTEVNDLDLPTPRKFRGYTKEYFRDAIYRVKRYLNTILQDEGVHNFKEVFKFFHPTREELFPFQRRSGGKNRLQHQPNSAPAIEEDEELEPLARPFFKLVNEVFELRGMLGHVRQSFIAFVRATANATVSKQLRQFIDYFLQETMLLYYMQNMQESMWPNGKLSDRKPLTNDEKDELRLQTLESLYRWIHDSRNEALSILLGAKNVKRGALKMFNSFQDQQANRHLLILILETLVFELVPALKDNNIKM